MMYSMHSVVYNSTLSHTQLFGFFVGFSEGGWQDKVSCFFLPCLQILFETEIITYTATIVSLKYQRRTTTFAGNPSTINADVVVWRWLLNKLLVYWKCPEVNYRLHIISHRS